MNENRHICRGKRDPDGRWFEGFYLCLQGIDNPLHIIVDRTGQYIRIKPETLGECTGCLDKLGRLIFEGDIVKNTEIGIVRYVAEEAAFLIFSTENDNAHYMYLTDNAYEIIGCIHEEQLKM